MAFITLEDETGRMETVVFPKTFEQVEGLLIENQAIYIEGKLNLRDGELSILADTISHQPPDNSTAYDFVIRIPKGTNQNKLVQLNRLLKKHPNGHKGLIILPNGKNLPLSYGVKYNSALQEQIDFILGL